MTKRAASVRKKYKMLAKKSKKKNGDTCHVHRLEASIQLRFLGFWSKLCLYLMIIILHLKSSFWFAIGSWWRLNMGYQVTMWTKISIINLYNLLHWTKILDMCKAIPLLNGMVNIRPDQNREGISKLYNQVVHSHMVLTLGNCWPKPPAHMARYNDNHLHEVSHNKRSQ